MKKVMWLIKIKEGYVFEISNGQVFYTEKIYPQSKHDKKTALRLGIKLNDLNWPFDAIPVTVEE